MTTSSYSVKEEFNSARTYPFASDRVNQIRYLVIAWVSYILFWSKIIVSPPIHNKFNKPFFYDTAFGMRVHETISMEIFIFVM